MTTSASMSTVVRRRDAALLARRYARAQCAGHTPPTLVEDVELVVSELVANAVRHGAGTITLVLALLPDGVRVAVADQGPGAPTLVDAGLERTDGRGLALVDRLAAEWGVDRLPDGGKEVWCVVSAAAPDVPVRAGEPVPAPA